MLRAALFKLCVLAFGLLAGPLAQAIYYHVDMTGPGILVSDEFGLFGPPSGNERSGEVRVSFTFEVPAPDSKPPTRSYFVLQDGQAWIEIAIFGRSINAGIDYALLEFDQYQPGDFSIYGGPSGGPGAQPSGFFGFGVVPGPLSTGHYPDALDYPNALGAGNFTFYDAFPGSSVSTELQFTDYRPAVVTTLPEPSALSLVLGALGLLLCLRARRLRRLG